MAVPLGREYLRHLRVAAGLLALVGLGTTILFVIELSRKGGELAVIHGADYPEGPLRWGPALYSYNEAKVWPSGVSGANGERLLELRLQDASRDTYLGVGFGGSFHVPKDAQLVLEWSRKGYAPSMEFHLVDAGPGSPGEVFSAILPLIGEGWIVSRVPLASFTRNAFQDASRPKDGVLNSDGIQAVEIAFPAGTQMTLQLRKVSFVWGSGIHPSLFALPPLVALGLLLSFRSLSLETLRGPGQRFAISRLTNRYVLAFVTAAIVAMQFEADRRSLAAIDLLALGCAAALVLVDEAWSSPLQRSQLWTWRYMALFTVALVGGSAPTALQYGLLCAAAVAPTFERQGWQRHVLFALLAFALVVITRPFAPVTTRPGHLAAAAVVALLMLVVAEYLRSREQMQLTARTLQLYDGIFHQSSEGIYTFDEDGTVTSVNPGFERLLGRPAVQLVGSLLEGYVAPEDHPLLAEVRAANTGHTSIDLRFLDAAGALRYTMTRIQPVAGESAAGFQAISTDISDRRLLEEELLKANRELQTLSERDGLTGLYNRRCFDRQLSQEFARAWRARSPLALVLCDIDQFKDYNDSLGHQGGDELLRAVSPLLAGFARRAGEMAARYGGDEFALILPGVDTDALAVTAERLRASLEAAARPHPSSRVSRCVTLSIGATSVLPSAGFTPDDVLAAADRALYQAKERGRNRVVVSTDVRPRA